MALLRWHHKAHRKQTKEATLTLPRPQGTQSQGGWRNREQSLRPCPAGTASQNGHLLPGGEDAKELLQFRILILAAGVLGGLGLGQGRGQSAQLRAGLPAVSLLGAQLVRFFSAQGMWPLWDLRRHHNHTFKHSRSSSCLLPTLPTAQPHVTLLPDSSEVAVPMSSPFLALGLLRERSAQEAALRWRSLPWPTPTLAATHNRLLPGPHSRLQRQPLPPDPVQALHRQPRCRGL